MITNRYALPRKPGIAETLLSVAVTRRPMHQETLHLTVHSPAMYEAWLLQQGYKPIDY